MAAPYPAPRRGLAVSNERGGLRVVNYDNVLGKLDSLAILLVVHQENIASMLRESVIAALKRIVESLGHFEEVVASGDDFPIGLDLNLIEQRDQLIEHLGDSATHGGGIYHLHRFALQLTGEESQFIDVCCANNTSVVVQKRGRNGRGRCLPRTPRVAFAAPHAQVPRE